MTDDVEPTVRQRLASARLPAAPAELRAFVVDLAAQPVPRRRLFGDRRILLAVPVVLLIGVLAGVGLAGTAPKPTASVALPSESPPDTLARFSAPGITFTYPSAWTSAGRLPDESQRTWSRQDLGLLIEGPQPCWLFASPDPTLPPQRRCPGDAQLDLTVTRYPHPVPGEPLFGRPTTFAPTPRWEAALVDWYFTDPNGGLYNLRFRAASYDLESRRADMLAVVDSVQVSAWSPPTDPVVDGLVRTGTDPFSFAYPVGWSAYHYMPWYLGMQGTGDLTWLVASTPLAPCTPADYCNLEQPPSDAVVVQFEPLAAGPFWSPNWTQSNDTIGGQPAIRRDVSVYNGTEHTTWDVEFAPHPGGGPRTPGALEITAALSPTGDAALRQQLMDFLAKLVVPD